jgi:subfamily B ATP-binding cassette protein MsbA
MAVSAISSPRIPHSGILPAAMFQFLLKVWGLARPYRVRLFLGVLTGMVAGLMEPLMVASVTFVYGLVFPSAHAPALAERLKGAPEFLRDWAATADQSLAISLRTHPGAVIFLVCLIPLVMVFRGLFGYLNVYFLQWTAIRAITDLRVRLFDHLMRLSVGFFSRTNTGDLMSRLMNDTGALQGVLSNATSVMVKDPVIVVSIFGYLLWQQPKITMISMVVMPVCMVPIIIYNRKVRRSSRAMQTHAAELGSVMVESFSGSRIIKAYNLETTVSQQFRSTAAKFIGHYMRIIRSSEIPGPLLEFVGSLGVSLVLLYLISQGGEVPQSKDFLAVIAGIFAVYRPLKNLTRLYNGLEQARAASERVFELLATKNDIPEPATPKPLKAAGAAIYFENIRFAYGEKTILEGVNLTVKPGQLVALVGASGSGKTTMTSLLLRFYDPQEGRIRIGDVDIREVASQDLRSQIAVVTQETVLFNETILRNIELGRPGATRSEIMEAARHAHAHEFIMNKPDGFETVIGERGVLLSGGQRQRLAIARAVLKDAPILVLDEATSSLDTESERAVQAALEELMQGRTTLCIAHRLSTIQKADLIVVLDSGRIVETGTHAALMEQSGIYRRLYEMQFRTPDLAS